MKKSAIYTKTGDKGTTALIGGTRVKKHNSRLNAYGTVDELNSFIGMIRSFHIDAHTKETIITIQNELFVIGAYLATDSSVSDLRDKLNCDDSKIELLELRMDQMESNLPPLSNFVLPGGHPVVAYCHICRTICRRAERIVSELSDQMEINSWVLRYLNRLSDYFFVLSRQMTNYFQVEEIPWQPKL
jgi:ATP:cob(I)alamin adenosyltransferase